MNRNDIAGILNGLELTDAQVKGLLDLNSTDITKALGKQKDELNAANVALNSARETIASLEASKADADELQKQIDEYREADEKRIAAEKAAAEHAEIMSRMDAVLGGRKFVHDRMRDIVAGEFSAALADKANRGKADKEIFDAVTRDQGYFASQNPPADMGPVGNFPSDEAAKLSDQEYYARLYAATN